MKRLRESIIPPGGFHFIDRSGDVEQRIEGDSVQDVVTRVLRHRLANRRPPGNPMLELIEYVCSRWPQFCYDDDRPRMDREGDDSQHISRRCAAWMGQFYQRAANDEGVGDAEAARRAAICAQCPANKEYNAGCAACNQQVEQLGFIFRRGRSTGLDRQLKCCDVLSMALKAAVWAKDLPPPTAEQQAQLPEGCWRK